MSVYSLEKLQEICAEPNDSFSLGEAAAFVANLVHPESEAAVVFGLEPCGIGGFTCSCNEQRVPEGIDVYDFVDGLKSAKYAITREKVAL